MKCSNQEHKVGTNLLISGKTDKWGAVREIRERRQNYEAKGFRLGSNDDDGMELVSSAASEGGVLLPMRLCRNKSTMAGMDGFF